MILDALNELKREIEKDIFDGMFTSHHIIDNSGYVDFVFIGRYNDKDVIWNACMTTTRGDYFDAISEKASDEGYELYPSTVNLLDCLGEPDEHGNRVWCNPEDEELSRTRRKYIAQRTMELIDSGTEAIKTVDIEIDEDYQYGIGLHIRLNVDAINVDDVKNFIREFNILGPTMYDSIPRELNTSTYTVDELGVELHETGEFVLWSDNFSHNTVGIRI